MAGIMKTPITVLQEMMMKVGVTPEYECVSQSGPQHQAMFEYVCRARGHTARGAARSKKEAKQEAARALLAQLAAAGESVPPGAGADAPPPAPPHSYVALLKELCEEYKFLWKPPGIEQQNEQPTLSERSFEISLEADKVSKPLTNRTDFLDSTHVPSHSLPAADYELVGDTGPPHLRHFTVRAKLGQHARLATATTKKAARQLAAEDLYHYLRENLKRTRDFVEEEALVRHHEKVMERYRETRAEQLARPCLAQRLADYHLGLHETFDAEARALAREALASTAGRGGEVELGCAAGALGMEVEWASLPRERARPLQVVSLSPSAPPLAFAGESRDQAAAAAAAYLRRALPDPPAAAAAARALTVDDLLS